MRTLSNKVKVMLILALTAIMSVTVGLFCFAKAENKIEGLWEVKTFQMEDARLLVEGENGVNGLQFVASMSADEFEGFMALVGPGKLYESFRTNLIIMPESYVEKTGLPGDMYFEGTYDWAEWDEERYEYVYTPSDKIRVININANSWVKEGDKYVYTGAIVDILEHNETVDFRAWAYIEGLEWSGGYSTAWTLSEREATDPKAYTVTSIPKQVSKELSTLSQSQKEWVFENWVAIPTVEDTTEYLVDVKDKKNFDLIDAIKDEDAIAHINSFTGLSFSFKVTDVNGMVKTDRILDVTDPDNLRLWDLEISLGEDLVYKGKVDLYNSSESAVWNDLTEGLGTENALRVLEHDGFKLSTATKSREIVDGKVVLKATGVSESFYVSVLPLHSKAYYNLYRDADYTFSYSWKYTSKGTWNSGSQAFYFIKGTAWDATHALDTWYTHTVSIAEVVDNWDNFTDFSAPIWDYRPQYSMFCTYNLLNSNDNVDVYVSFSFTDNKAVNTMVDLSEVADPSELNLSEVMNSGLYRNLKNGYPNATWSLVAFDGGKTVIDSTTSFDATKLAKQNYTLTVESDGLTVFTGDFDIFDSTEDLVWNTPSTSNIAYVKSAQFKSTGGEYLKDNVIIEDGYFKVTGNPFVYTGENASDLQFLGVTILPLHSRNYYQQYYGQGLVVRMTVIKLSPLHFTVRQFMDENYHRDGTDINASLTYRNIKQYVDVTIKLDTILDNWSVYHGAQMINDGNNWTLSTWQSQQTTETQLINLYFGDITLTQPATETTGVGQLKGKQVAVIGDSISTWNKNVHSGATYPNVSNNATHGQNITMNDTWWKQVIDNYGMELVKNCANSGATAGHGVLMSGNPTSNSRLNVCATNKSLSLQGVNPDLVLVYIGMNDMCRGSTIIKEGDDINSQAFYDMIPGLFAEFNSKYQSNIADYGMALSQSLGLDTYARAYAYIIYSIQKNYPNADIVCVNLPEEVSTAPQYNQVISTVASHYGVPVVDLYTAFKNAGGVYDNYTYDNLHPNAEGFDIMSNAVIAKMNEVYGK